MTVDILIEDPAWDALGLEALADAAVAAALQGAGLDPDAWEISLLACDDARIQGLNDTFRGKDRATNVLSWPSAERGPDRPGDPPAPPDPTDPELGDIALARETVLAEAAAGGIDPAHHIIHLIVHGTLHLLGYDHETEADADRMETLETRILAGLGIPDPYATVADG